MINGVLAWKRTKRTFKEGEVLADRGFCSFASLATLLAHGVDAVMRVHHFRKRDWRAGRRLGWRDRLVRWVKGPFQGQFWTRAVGAVAGSDHRAPGGNSGGGAGLPHAAAGGGHDAVGRANLWRGGVGPFIFSPLGGGVVFSRHQNHAGFDVLRYQTPAMVRKEIAMHALAYNLNCVVTPTTEMLS